MPVPTGATLAIVAQGNTANDKFVTFYLSGTYTAADFTLDYSDGLGFNPTWGRVSNITDRTETEGTNQSATGLVTVAAGTRTAAAHGITFGSRRAVIDVSVAGPVTDNDAALIEFRG